MKATAVYENNNLKLMLEDSGEHTLQLEAAFYQKQGELFVKEFQGEFSNANQIIKNFERLMSYAFEQGEWEKALLQFAKICKENKIVWFLTGSACDAVRGMDIRPHDLDIEIFSGDWKKAEKILENYIVEPFIETTGWARDYFGRIVVENTLVDVVADEKYDFPNYPYEPVEWNGYTLWLEPFANRYRTEQQRKRRDRIEKFEEYLKWKMGLEIVGEK